MRAPSRVWWQLCGGGDARAREEHRRARAGVCALLNLTGTDEENRSRAGTAGAVEDVAAAMRTHAGSTGVQVQACWALRNMVGGTNVENRTRAGTAGGVEAVAVVMRAHAGSAGARTFEGFNLGPMCACPTADGRRWWILSNRL